MEIPTIEDFKRLESSMLSKFEELKSLLNDENSRPKISMVLSIKQVEDEFKLSEYHQRNARLQGSLVYSKIGKEILYKRQDVETWIQSVTIKY